MQKAVLSMAKHISVYPWSQQEAQKLGEVDRWRESYKENCTCARAIEQAISENYSDNHLNTDMAKDIIERFGFNRVNWVLANTIQRKVDDGRISQSNKEWAAGFYIPNDDVQWHYEVDSHPGLTDLFVNRVRQEWQSLGLFDRSHCSEEDDYEGKLLILSPSTLKDEYKTPEDQLFFATSGFGCDPSKMGTAVYGFFVKDEEHTHFRRSDFIGVIKAECIPEWASEKLAVMNSDESENIAIGGMQQ